MMSHPVLHEAFTLIVTVIRSLLYTYTVCVNGILYDVCVKCILYVLTVRKEENRRGGIASLGNSASSQNHSNDADSYSEPFRVFAHGQHVVFAETP